MQVAVFRFVTCWIVLALGTTVVAQDFKQYPGSRLDEKAGAQASSSSRGVKCEVYTTTDDYDKIYAFYKGVYREFVAPFPKPQLPNGKEIRWAFFILDGGKDLAHSQYWLKIQRPYIGAIGDGDLDFKDIRDLSVIQTVHTRPRGGVGHLLELNFQTK